MMKTSRQGWIGLQRRKGAEFRQWLSESQALQTGFSVLTKSLHALLEHRVRTKEDVRNVWDAVPAVMGKCDHPSTYRMPGAASAYSWLHLPDRYVRTWRTLEKLVEQCLLPMGKEGVRALDVGTGPGPSAFATHDFYAAMTAYAEVSGNELWRQPAQMTCVEHADTMNQFRHHLAEFMAMRGAPHGVLAMCSDIGRFESILPPDERKLLSDALRKARAPYFDEHTREWEWERQYTPEEANDIANRHHRYRLFTFSNFLTKETFTKNLKRKLEDILRDANAGSMLLLIGGKSNEYRDVYDEVTGLAQKGGFSPELEDRWVSSSYAGMDKLVYAGQARFYRRLRRIACDLPERDCVAETVKRHCEGEEIIARGTSSIHAYRS